MQPKSCFSCFSCHLVLSCVHSFFATVAYCIGLLMHSNILVSFHVVNVYTKLVPCWFKQLKEFLICLHTIIHFNHCPLLELHIIS
jgi:hypothetical protein